MPRTTKPNLQRLLKKWQPRLHLQHWEISLKWNSYEALKGNVGLCHYKTDHLAAEISIAELDSLPPDTWEQYKNIELTVVHELMHLVLAQVFDRVKAHPTVDDLKEQAVETLAKVVLGL